jgi:hypothetical protein
MAMMMTTSDTYPHVMTWIGSVPPKGSYVKGLVCNVTSRGGVLGK